MHKPEGDAGPSGDSPISPSSRPQDERAVVGPADTAQSLWRLPLSRSDASSWDSLVLQRLRHSTGRIDVPARQSDVFVGHFGGPFLAEAGVGTPHYERKWVRPGDLGLNPAGLPVRRDIKGRSDVVLVHIPPGKLRAVAEEMFEVDPSRVDLVPLLAAPDETAHRLIGLLLGEAVSPAPGSPLMADSLAHALMVHVLRRHSSLAARRPDPVEPLSSGRVRRVVDHMRSSLHQPLSLTDLARIGGMSPSRFVRAFHEAIGQPPHRFLVGLRIERACRLLEATDLPITEVGLRCGFDQSSHFAAMFRKAVGMTPGAWRRERRK